METLFENFTNLYSLSKTLRFELKPVGRTQEFIEQNGILEKDRDRAESYKLVKKIIDEYHKVFIDMVLENFVEKLNDDEKEAWNNSINDFYMNYHANSSEENKKDNLLKAQIVLRTLISECFTSNKVYARLFGMQLIREDLIEFVNSGGIDSFICKQKGNEDLTQEEILVIREKYIQEIEKFADFTTYFSGFNDNRKNLYVADDKSTSIAHRVITENLPKFVDNIDVFAKISASNVAIHFDELYRNMEPYLNVNSLNEMFSLDYFHVVLTQKQIDVYNSIICGITLEDGTPIKGLNQYVNDYNQIQKDKHNKLPKLKTLFKQILSERNAVSWLPDEFINDNEMLNSIESFYQDLRKNVFECKTPLRVVLETLGSYDLEHVYLPNDLQLTEISQRHYGNWCVLKDLILEDLKAKFPKSKTESVEDYDKRLLKKNDCFSIAYIDSLISKTNAGYKPIEDYFSQLGAYGQEQESDLFARIVVAHEKALSLLTSQYPENKQLSQDKENVEKIRILLDSIKSLQHFVKPLLDKGAGVEKDNRFYGDFIPLWEFLDNITPLYDMVRNRMKKKICSDEKIRLFFDNKNKFLNGWVDSKTETSDNATQYGGYLFRKTNSTGEYDYYLGVSASTKLFRRFNKVMDSDKSEYERLDYYQMKSNTFYGALYKGNYKEESTNIIDSIDSFVKINGNKEIIGKIDSERTKKQPKVSSASGYLSFLKQNAIELYNKLLKDSAFETYNCIMISSMKSTLMSLERIPIAKEYCDREYVLFSDMMDAIDELLRGKMFSYFPVSQSELDNVMNRSTKPLYLFKITNKDLSFAENHEKGLRKSKGTDNLHTMYFKALLSGVQNVFDIGSGSIFFREKKIEYPEDKMKTGHHHELLKDKFSYPIISNKRYAYDKFQFHLSVIINYNADKSKDMNTLANQALKEFNATHIIGIDRGERNLLYLSLIDMQGNIVKQFSLNTICNEYKGNIYEKNYHELLDSREKQNDDARRSWHTIENIKELKEGYMSHVIHKIAQLMVEYNAIVVLENLNYGFMRGRQKVEKQVYQKFEKMLIDKLNYLADKKRNISELGGILNAYQLTSKYEASESRSKQNGFLFYIPAWNTSKIDPVTGFANLFDTRMKTEKEIKEFFEKFSTIRYNSEGVNYRIIDKKRIMSKGYFEFVFDYNNFTSKAEGTRTTWTLCTYGERIRTFRNKEKNSEWDNETIDLTTEFMKLFEEWSIDLDSNLKEAISNLKSKEFFEKLCGLFKLLLQLRNSKTGTEEDYILSPVADENGSFFDSRVSGDNLPMDADANGAYNIARKGLWAVMQIRKSKNPKNVNLDISNKEWLDFVQKKLYLENNV